MIRLLVVSDDFTGSLDTGVQFAKHGIDTLVCACEPGNPVPAFPEDVEVLVIDSETRHIKPADAYRHVYEIVRAANAPHVYKKTDSTLRGNIGAELRAVLDAAGAGELMFVPALPKAGRTTAGGVQFVGGVPLAESDFSGDPFNPMRKSAVAEILKEQTDLGTRTIPKTEYSRVFTDDGRIAVFDAETDEDILRAGQAIKAAGKLRALAGCAGFAEALPELIDFTRRETAFEKARGPALLACGSLHPASVAQTEYAIECCGYAQIALDARLLLGAEELDATAARAAGRLSKAENVALRARGGRAAIDEARDLAPKLGIPPEAVPGTIARNTGRLIAAIAERAQLGTLVVFGGDTLLGAAKALGATAIRPRKELLPGVVLARFESARAPFDLVTKAGGFGDRDAVLAMTREWEKLP